MDPEVQHRLELLEDALFVLRQKLDQIETAIEHLQKGTKP